MKAMAVSCGFLTCVAFLASSVLHAQARSPASRPPGAAASNAGPQDSGAQDMSDPQPCRARTVEDSPFNWWSTASITICGERLRSQAVALARAQGLDEHGVPLDANARAAELRRMEAWLRRLAGKFSIEGHRWNSSGRTQVHGAAECFAIGSGPGVSCVISATWKTGKESGTDANASHFAVRPQVLLFGLDPDAMEIAVTHVDSRAVGMRGILLDGAVILEPLSSPEIAVVNRALIDAFILSPGGGTPARTAPDLLTRVAPQSLGRDVPDPLSRVAIAADGGVAMTFHVYPQDSVTFFNQPIEFDLRLSRNPPAEMGLPNGVP